MTMSKDQMEHAASWLRGDLPTWATVILMAIMGWAGQKAYEHFSTTLSKAVDVLNNHETRITVLEKSK